MAERITLQDAGYVLYADMLARLRERFPEVPLWRLEQVINTENDAVTGGILQIVPAEVESGSSEMLEREQRLAQGEDEVA